MATTDQADTQFVGGSTARASCFHLQQQFDIAAGRGARRAGSLGARHRHVLPCDGSRVQVHQLRHVLQLHAGQITFLVQATNMTGLPATC